jgi:hypothetical protein
MWSRSALSCLLFFVETRGVASPVSTVGVNRRPSDPKKSCMGSVDIECEWRNTKNVRRHELRLKARGPNANDIGSMAQLLLLLLWMASAAISNDFPWDSPALRALLEWIEDPPTQRKSCMGSVDIECQGRNTKNMRRLELRLKTRGPNANDIWSMAQLLLLLLWNSQYMHAIYAL